MRVQGKSDVVTFAGVGEGQLLSARVVDVQRGLVYPSVGGVTIIQKWIDKVVDCFFQVIMAEKWFKETG